MCSRLWLSCIWRFLQMSYSSCRRHTESCRMFKQYVTFYRYQLVRRLASCTQVRPGLYIVFSVASNAIQTIGNETTYLIIYWLNCIRCDGNLMCKTGLLHYLPHRNNVWSWLSKLFNVSLICSIIFQRWSCWILLC